MSFELTFRDLLLQNPDAVTEKKRFTGLMRDLFPGQQMQINLICMAWDLGIVSDIQATQHINNSFAFRYVKRLVDEYGVSRLNADWAISIWCVCYGQYVLQSARLKQAKLQLLKKSADRMLAPSKAICSDILRLMVGTEQQVLPVRTSGQSSSLIGTTIFL